MASRIDIINLALTRIGESRIEELDENSKAADEARAIYDLLLDSELMANRWGFAQRRAALAVSAIPPAWGYAYRYPVPVESLSVVYVEGQEPAALDDFRQNRFPTWQIEGRDIVTDLPAPLNVIYIARVENPDEWNAAFRSAFSFKLAEVLAIPIAGDQAIRDRMAQAYEVAIRDARQQSAIQAAPQFVADSTWLQVRG